VECTCHEAAQYLALKESQSAGTFEAFAEVMFQIEVFWPMTPFNVVVGYQHFRGPVKTEAARTSESWSPTTTPHGVTAQKTST
jgi:hypothetical protein